MATITFKPIIKAIKKSGFQKKEIAAFVGIRQDTLYHFLKSGKKMKQQLKTLSLLCDVLDIDWRTIIK
jgi:DNA-binding Xre family transcriptional regulator